MNDHHDRPAAARHVLDLLTVDLSTVSGQLEELATIWRRQCAAGNSWRDMPHAFPQGLRDAERTLASILRALSEAGPDQAPDLASSASSRPSPPYTHGAAASG